MTSAMQELIEYVKLVERTSGHDDIQIKSVLDYAEKMLEKEIILEKTLVKHAVTEALKTGDDLMDISMSNYFDTIYNKVNYREK